MGGPQRHDMSYMFRDASAFDQDLGWCVDDDVGLRRIDVDVASWLQPPDDSPTPRRRLRPTPRHGHARADACHFRSRRRIFTCAGITLADAEAHAPVYAAAVADIYNVDESKVIVTFAAYRRRLQSSGDIVVSYVILYASAAAATAAANAASSHTASTFQSAVQSAASNKGVSSVFAATTVQSVATPATTTTTPPPSPLPPSSSGGGGGGDDGGTSSSSLSSSSSKALDRRRCVPYYWKKKKDKGGTKVATPGPKTKPSPAPRAATGADAGGPTMEVGRRP